MISKKIFRINSTDYHIVRNPHTNGPMIARVDGFQIDNRKEICRIFLRSHGWTDEMFGNRITNDLERQINKILNGNGIVPVVLETNNQKCDKIKKTQIRKKVDSVIVVRMYAGGYLDENLGHETINTFKTDNGEHYIYVNPWGLINEEYSESKNVILVRGISANVWEVIGYATKLDLLLKTFNSKDTNNINQSELIKQNNINYGGIAVDKLMSDQTSVVYVTYKANEYHSVKEGQSLYLVSDAKEIKGDNYILLPNVNFAKQALHMYMDEERKKDAYNRLLGLFKEEKWWDNDSCHSLGNINDYNDSFNILDVIKRDEDELTFSNWLAYYLSNDNKFLKEFSKEILSIDINVNKSIVRREYKNIDIWIEDDNNIIVIENKIKSGINGVVEERHDFSKNEIKSQLSKYVKIANSESKGRNTKFCLLIPDYGVSDDDLMIYEEYDKYLPALRYSKLLKFLECHNTNLPYYDDYKKAVKKHASKYKKNLYEVMEERLINKIKKFKK